MAPVRQSKLGQKRFWYSVPAVMPASAARAGHSASRPKPLPSLPETTMATPTKPSTRPEPLPRQHRFVQQPAGADGGQQRLDADHQAGYAGRQALRDRDEYAAEIDRVHQQAGDADVEPLPRASVGQGARVASAIRVISDTTSR
jgi:hypothetical protein